jgi:two-component system sensor histidine kinase TctE
VHESATRSAHLVNQLLTLARAEPESAAAQARHRVDLRRLAAEVCAEAVPRARQAGIDLGFESEGEEAIEVLGHPLLLREALANVVDNALRYAGRGREVTVRVRRAGPDAVAEVEDNGPGIAPTDRERVFERFARATHEGDGAGLGLAIVKEIVQRHHGSVSLEGAAPRGLRVRIGLPLAATANEGS